MERTYMEGTWQTARSFSPAVITEGAARTIYVAGHGAPAGGDGNSLGGDFGAAGRRTSEAVNGERIFRFLDRHAGRR